MKELKLQLETFLKENKKEIIKFLSRTVQIKSYSGNESKLINFIREFLYHHKIHKNSKIITLKNNLLMFYNANTSNNVELFYDAHLDTVPAEETNSWRYPPFSGKLVENKIYGRGSCDDKGSVTSLVFAFLFLNKFQLRTPPICFSLSSSEENSSGKGIEEVVKYVKPKYSVICEPSDLKIVYGHKGKWSIKLIFSGKSAHSSLPHLGKNAIYLGYPVIRNLIETKNENFKPSKLGTPTYTITFIESKTNSLNSIPYECSLYIDYRSVLGETEATIKNFILKNIKHKNYKFLPQHRFFKAWILNEEDKLLTKAMTAYKECFLKSPKPILWQFCTNGSITMADFNIPTVGFGPGSPFLAHQDNEYIKVEDVLAATKFYCLLAVKWQDL